MKRTQTTPAYPWWAGNARLIDQSNTFIVAHVAHGALIMLWVGLFTLFELLKYNPAMPLYAQGLILLPHLAALGLGVGQGGQIVHTFPYVAVAGFHLVAAGVLAWGGVVSLDQTAAQSGNGSATGREIPFSLGRSGSVGVDPRTPSAGAGVGGTAPGGEGDGVWGVVRCYIGTGAGRAPAAFRHPGPLGVPYTPVCCE